LSGAKAQMKRLRHPWLTPGSSLPITLRGEALTHTPSLQCWILPCESHLISIFTLLFRVRLKRDLCLDNNQESLT
jgi:hypothetical protein